jgi:YjbE family integral membrane protein
LELEALTIILMIIGIDIVLGGDNAIVIALACRNLPENQRNKAIILGTGLAIIVRILLTMVAVYLLTIPYLQFAGGILLISIAIKLLIQEEEQQHIKASVSIFAAIKTIVFADIVMGLDNVLAVAGAAHGNLTFVVIGLLVSVPIIVWGSKIVLYLMEQFSFLVYVGSGILAFTAGKMITHEEKLAFFFHSSSTLYIVPTLLVVFVVAIGFIFNQKKTNRKKVA